MKIETVDADQIEPPWSSRSPRKYGAVYAQMSLINVGQAVRLTFDTLSELQGAYTSLRASLMSKKSQAKTWARMSLAGTKRWNVIKDRNRLTVAVVRLPDAPPDDDAAPAG